MSRGREGREGGREGRKGGRKGRKGGRKGEGEREEERVAITKYSQYYTLWI